MERRWQAHPGCPIISLTVNRRFLWAVLALVALGLPSCHSSGSSYRDLLGKYPYKDASNYPFDPATPLYRRIGQTPPILLECLKRADGVQSYAPYAPSPEEADLVEEYLSFLPGPFSRLMSEKVAGIYFIENFMGGGMSDLIYDAEGNRCIVLILNAAILKTPLGDWISYRDASAFKGGTGFVLENPLGKKFMGLLHTLFHEASHIYDFFHHVTPFVEPGPPGSPKGPGKGTAFTESAWRDYGLPAAGFDFPERNNASFYGLGKAIANSQAAAAYGSLAGTPFSSLYGSLNWAEDFAETFTWFYLYENFSLEYEVKVIVDGRERLSYSPLRNRSAASRYALFEDTLR
jgi:hypothetical protein